jgi:hypothetical protein
MNEESVYQGCGTPPSPDEVYACADCSDWWEMTGVEVSKQMRSESDE